MLIRLLFLFGLAHCQTSTLPQQHWAVSGSYNTHIQRPECKSDTYNVHDQMVKEAYGNGIGVQCCGEWGVGTRPGCEKSMAKQGVKGVKYSFTFDEAKQHCEDAGMRLCTREEVDSGAGKGTGCAFDANLVWTSTPCHGRHWIVDGNSDNMGSADDQCKSDMDTKHDQDTGYGLDIGVQCCDDNGKGSRPGCAKTKNYDEAYAICAAKGLRLCSREEVNNNVNVDELPPIAPKCPSGSVQIGGLNADIAGCGLEGCNARYQKNYPDIDSCLQGCIRNAKCKSFNWAPMDGDKNHKGNSVCTLYDSDKPTRKWGPLQIMCQPQQSKQIPFSCQVRRGNQAKGIGAISTVSCNSDETLVSCGIDGWQHIGGVHSVDGSKCTALSHHDSSVTVTAVANCCKFPSDAMAKVHTVKSAKSGTFETAQCESTSVITGCDVFYSAGSYNKLLGSYAGPTSAKQGPPQTSQWIDTANMCTAGSRKGTSITATAHCLEFAKDYTMDCKTKAEFTTKAGFAGCEKGYEIMSCNTWTTSYSLDDYHLQTDKKCYVQQDGWKNMYANAICCKLSQVPPTPEPDTSCLAYAPNCYQITDKNACLSSKDARAGYKDQQCVWCGGGKCTSKKSWKCEPANWLAAQKDKVNEDKYEYAADSCNKPQPNMSCLNYASTGCHKISDKKKCLSSKEGRASFKDQQCVWCGGGKCTSKKNYKCEPANWLASQPDKVNEDKYEFAADTCTQKNSCSFDGTLVWTSSACEIFDATSNTRCDALDIDRFLTQCSPEFEGVELEIATLKTEIMDLRKDMDALLKNNERNTPDLPPSDNDESGPVDDEKDDKQGESRPGDLPSQHWTVDGNLESGGVDGKPECKLDSETNSVQDVGFGTGIGYQCCKDVRGSRPDCAVGGAYTYAQSVAKCKAAGKVLCTRKQVEAGQGAGTGCQFDGTQVWTSTVCYEHKSSAQMAPEMRYLNYPSTSSFSANQNLIIGALVVFNVATIIGCIACLFGKMNSKSKVVFYNDVQQDEADLIN